MTAIPDAGAPAPTTETHTPGTLYVLLDRIRQRRWLVLVIAILVTCGAYAASHGKSTTYTSRVLVSAASTRPPTQDAILAQGYTYFLNDPSYQSNLAQKTGFPAGITGFSAEFVTASPLFYIQVTAATPAVAKAAAPTVAQLFVDDVNGRLDASRTETAADMTAAMMKVWGDRLAANDPNAFSAQIQLQQEIDRLNADSSNHLTVLQSGAGVTATGPGRARGLATGLVGGLLLGCVAALIAGAATRRLHTEYDVVEKTGVRPFEVIPPGGTPERDARRAVALRHVANLVARAGTPASTSIAVIPISAGAGGDELARSIAEHRAAQGTPTVFVNANLRRAPGAPRTDTSEPTAASGQNAGTRTDDGLVGPVRPSADPQATEFIPRPERGLAEYLRGWVPDARELVTTHAPDGFAEIAAGATSPDPYPLFDRERVRALLDSVAAAADTVVLALPPITAAPEAQIVADLADLTILVIERGRTRVDEVREAVRAVNQVGAQVLGAVLIDTRAPRSSPRKRAGAAP
ncbi:hypothetical protein ABZ319_23190 [Nocardia sp. NPDC005978]|uniref:hypothetical protein n=1 Tax=Nocardia sp. NPDC005978 TaxID=3156725 RepID=UPI0033A3F286